MTLRRTAAVAHRVQAGAMTTRRRSVLPVALVLALVVALPLALPAAVGAQPADPPLLVTRIDLGEGAGRVTRHPRLLVVDTDASVRRLVAGDAERGSWAPDGLTVAYQASDGVRVVRRDGTDDRLLRADAVPAPQAWSPDGLEVLAVDAGGGLVALDAATGDERPLVALEGGRVTAPAWSPDGARVAFGVEATSGGQFALWVVDADGSDPRLLADDVLGAGHLAWSPDGTALAVAGTPGDDLADAGIWVVPTDGGAPRRLDGPPPAQVGPDQSVAWAPDGSTVAAEVWVDGREAVVLLDPDGALPPAPVPPAAGAVGTQLLGWSPYGDRLVVVYLDALGATTLRWVAPADGGTATVGTLPGLVGDVAVGVPGAAPPLPGTAARALWWSRQLPDGSAPTVLLGRTDDFGDALASGGVQGALAAPLLLTPPDRLDAAVADELVRLGASRVVVLGGPVAIGDAVVQDLLARGLAVERLAGDNRIATAVAAAEAVAPAPTRVLLARAFGDPDDSTRAFADSLAAGAAAAALGAPLLLTATGELSPELAAYLDRTPSIGEVVVVGGEVAVGEPVVAALQARGLAVVRVAGTERTATAAAVSWFAAEQAPGTEPGAFVLVDGEDPEAWADGFAAARLADPSGAGGVLLAAGGGVPQPTLGRLVDALPGATLACASLLPEPACRAAAVALSTTDPTVELRAHTVAGDVIGELRVAGSAEGVCLVAAVEGATLAGARVEDAGAVLLELPPPGGDGRSVRCLDARSAGTPDPAALEGADAVLVTAEGHTLRAPLTAAS